MKLILDFTNEYNAKAGESVVRGNIDYFSNDDLKGYEKIVAFEDAKEKLKDVENATFVKKKDTGESK